MVKLPTLPGQKEPPKLWPPTLPSTTIPTPFGSVHLPEYKVSLPKPPPFDEKSRSAMLHAIAMDASMVPGLIPFVGDIISETVSDLHTAELRKILTPSEYDRFVKYDKVNPNVIALMRALGKD
ncbi:unnamed protein product [marine sediment metagenome]|uniref:Uncharacterized protein n=1 Tax=marine sediment metagenome TaxID=412755 RepID=X1GLT5_9ZZZZ